MVLVVNDLPNPQCPERSETSQSLQGYMNEDTSEPVRGQRTDRPQGKGRVEQGSVGGRGKKGIGGMLFGVSLAQAQAAVCTWLPSGGRMV